MPEAGARNLSSGPTALMYRTHIALDRSSPDLGIVKFQGFQECVYERQSGAISLGFADYLCFSAILQ